MRELRLFLSLLTLASLFPWLLGQSTLDVKNVFTQLFTTEGYNKKIRPADDQTLATEIDLDFFLTGIIEFDEQEESLTTSGYMIIFWTDQSLEWDPTSYNGVESIFIPQDDVWKADISLRNTYKDMTTLGSSHLNVYVTSTGDVMWYPFQILKSTCGVDITYFPFDVQECSLKFVAWSYTKFEVNMTLGNRGIILDDYEANSAWSLIDTSADTEEESSESTVVFKMKLKRKPLFYVMNIIAPVLLLSLLNVCTFILPISSGERGSYAITVFLSLAVFLTIVSSNLPKNSDTTSLLGVYLMMMTSFSTIIVVLTLVQVRLASRDHRRQPIGCGLRNIIKLSMILRCASGCRRKQVYPSDGKLDSKSEVSDDDDDDDLTWPDAMDAVDFFSFWIFLLLTLIVTITLICLAISGP